jgi:hypothetical protein
LDTNVVKPAKSANITVMTLRSGPGKGRSGGPCSARLGGGPAGWPQAGQNRAPWGKPAPHFSHVSGNSAPQFKQKRAAETLVAPHSLQFIV